MKLLRIKLTNYRGIAEREIAFSETGVTVIEGPNEIGKSCIAEAFDLVLEELDSSQKREVLAAKPVDRDAGPEVEVEFETGVYRLKLLKRFVRRPITELEILAPRHEHVTGREAHARVRAILEETLDEGLWKALRIEQGEELNQPTLSGARSLAAALDRAAGTVPAGDDELALFDRVQSEYEQYWTAHGRAKAEHAVHVRTVEDCSALVESIEASLTSLQQSADRVATLDAEIRSLVPRCAEQEGRVAELREQQRTIDRLESDLATRQAADVAAASRAAQAGAAVSERQSLVSSVAEATEELRTQAQALEQAQPELAAAREQHELDVAAMLDARSVRDDAVRLARLLRADVEFLRDRTELANLRARSERAQAAQTGLVAVNAALHANHVDEEAIAEIRAFMGHLNTARARLDVARPTMALKSLAGVRVQVDGVDRHLEAGETIEGSVAGKMEIVIPEVVALSVTAGATDENLAQELLAAEENFHEACSAVGVADLDAAETAAMDRRRLDAERVAHATTLADALQGSSFEGLREAIATMDARALAHLANRPQIPTMRVDVPSAESAASEAERASDEVLGVAAETENVEAVSRDRLARLVAASTESEVRLRVERGNATRLADRLELARRGVSDEGLAEVRVQVDSEADAAHEASERALQELQIANAAGVPTLLANASQVLAQMQQDLRRDQDERLQLVAQLRERGEAGLAEQLDAAVNARDTAVAALSGYEHRAAARQLLFDRLKAARDRVRTAYVGPLTERVESLGRLVFGASFEVEIDDELKVVSRTLNGKTIPLTSLSAGAREQLAVIVRLSCGLIVAPDGGVPLILDDVLGYSDPDRLEAMGAVLAEAGRFAQVIVLTCYPDRYRQVGGAMVQRLA